MRALSVMLAIWWALLSSGAGDAGATIRRNAAHVILNVAMTQPVMGASRGIKPTVW